jgi:hypothetical protein
MIRKKPGADLIRAGHRFSQKICSSSSACRTRSFRLSTDPFFVEKPREGMAVARAAA